MTNLINKIKSTVSNIVLFTAAIAMTGLGFAFVGMMALFALVAVGMAMIAAPFVAQPEPTTPAPSEADVVA